jgi:hypothetical protein
MNEERLQAVDRVSGRDPDGATAAPDSQAAMTKEPAASRPAAVPEKFWDAEAGMVRTESLLKSYLELERKLGSMVALPADEADTEAYARLRRALGVPESADAYEIASPNTLLDPSPEINAKLHAAGFTPQQAQLVYDLASDHLLPLIEDVLDEFGTARDTERLESRFGGGDTWRAMGRQIRTWGQANLSGEVFNTLSRSYDGVLAMHQMMQAREPAVLREGDGPPAELDEAMLGKLMRDPRYWRDRDPDVVAKVTEGFRRLYPS